MPADLARDEGMRSVANRIAQMERLDYLVNNAGFGSKGKLANRPVAEQATMLELHVMAPMLLSRAALPGMIARSSGTIINVSSVASFIHSPGNVNYCATKAYLRVFSEGLARGAASDRAYTCRPSAPVSRTPSSTTAPRST